MIDEDNGTLRSIAWSEVFPWLILLRTLRPAIGFRSLMLAAVGALLMVTGWWVIDAVLNTSHEVGQQPAAESAAAGLPSRVSCPFASLGALVPDRPRFWNAASALRLSPPPANIVAPLVAALPPASQTPIVDTWFRLTSPVLRLFQPGLTLAKFSAVVLSGLWSLAVWAFFGAAISRTTAVQLACDERLSWGSVLRHTTTRWRAYFSAPLFPVFGILLISLPIALLGLLLRLGTGWWLVLALLWPLFLVGGLLIVLLLLGLIFGWPLMWGTVSTEATDAFDALSRSYAYVYQRPLHYLFYAIVAGVIGWLGWILVSEFAAGVVAVTFWAVSWGAGAPVALLAPDAPFGAMGHAGAALVHFWIGCVKWIAVGFLFSYFWTATTAMYFLLRRDVDSTEMDEVALEEDEPGYELPPLKTEGPGAPAVADAPSTPAKEEAEKPADEE